MLGPNDIEDWSDDYADLCAWLRRRPEFVELKSKADLRGLDNLSRQMFALLGRFCAEENLSEREIRVLIAALQARA